jgi:predicted MFS family arabinose efflux permease
LEPDETQSFTSTINLPWLFKILYGFISDNVQLFGSHRKSYVVLHSGCQTAVFLTLIFLPIKEPILITVLLTVTHFNQAFMDVVIDALMVTQSKNDAECGSEDLQGISWTLQAIGGIIGSIFSAFFTEYLTPAHSFTVFAVTSFSVMLAALRIDPNVEKSQ